MARSIRDIPKKKRGRPKTTGRGDALLLRLHKPQLDKLAAAGGTANASYGIETSTNLAAWSRITNISTDANGVATVQDNASISSPMRFYRAVAP